MSVFDSIRDQVALDRILSANGSGKAHCVAPDHQDNSPSMHLYDDHVHCFVCSFHGDATDVWAAMCGFDRPIDAALDLAREFGIKLPEMSPEVQQKAHRRREKEDLYLKSKLGHVTGRWRTILASASGGRVEDSTRSCGRGSCWGPTRTVQPQSSPSGIVVGTRKHLPGVARRHPTARTR